MRTTQPSIVYVLPDKLGGVLSNTADVLTQLRSEGFEQHIVLTHNCRSTDARSAAGVEADAQVTVEYSLPPENLYAVLRRLARAVPPGAGVLVANDWIELAMASVFDPQRMLVQILHGDYDYYYDLALKHERVIDAFVAITRYTHAHLQTILPHRAESIFFLPFGVPLAPRVRSATHGPLRLLFVGRLDRAKGVFDLPTIDAHLGALGVHATWTIVGDGPDARAATAAWHDHSRVRWLGMRPCNEVQNLCADHDVFVLPTQGEGLPRAALEAMSAGVVPVLSDVAGGVRDIVEPGVSGYLVPPGDTRQFAAAIAELARDPDRLDVFGLAARQTVVERFDIRERARGFAALYARWRELRRPRPPRVTLHYGSRLDSPWVPNAVVRALRSAWRRLHQERALVSSGGSR
jgi:glycosyltransferase involved in cell wall biosynthesis